MLKTLSELKVGDKLTHYKTQEKVTIEQILPRDEVEGANYYLPLIGYVRDQCMRKMFLVADYNNFIVG